MEKYENLGMIGEGSYGMVMKCKHKETSQLVAIKKFLETEEDKMVKKIALREVRMLKQLRHENLINLIEVFRRKKRLYLVFEFVDRTALDDLERYPTGADESYCKKVMWQVMKGVEFCHGHNILHRDVKPENILISKRGVVKLCDFGFARTIAPPGEAYTDYVATRWYRAPELLVGDTNYGRPVDIWAIGCLFSEMLTGEPLFPGESDIDQLYLITKCFGNLIARHREIFSRNPLFIGMRLPEARELEPLERRYPRLSPAAMDIIKWSLRLDPNDRPTCSQLLRHELFTKGSWSDKFAGDLRVKIQKELEENPLLKNLGVTIYGSVHEAKHSKSELHKKEVPSAHAGVSSSVDPLGSDVDGPARKKEKRKKTKKELLTHREKTLPERIGDIKKPSQVKAHPSKLDFPPSLHPSHHILTGSQTRLTLIPVSPRRELGGPVAGQRNGHEQVLTHVIAPTPSRHSLHPPFPPHPPPSHSPHPPFPQHLPPSHSPHPPFPQHPPPSHSPLKSQISFASPPTSLIDSPAHSLQRHTGGPSTLSNPSLSNTVPGLRSEQPSETSLLSEKLYHKHSKHSTLFDKLGSQASLTSLTPTALSPGLPKHPGPSFKKHYSKNKDTFLLPSLKDAERHHAKAAAHSPLSPYTPHPSHPHHTYSTFSGLTMGTGLQSGMAPTNSRGFLLAAIPQIASLEPFKGSIRPPPTPPSQTREPNAHPETSTSFHLV